MSVEKKIKYKDQRLTKAQQKKAKAVKQAGIKNFLGKQKTVTVPKKWLSSSDHVVAELAYITPKEQKILLDANLYGSLNGQPNRGPGGIMSLQGAGDGGGSEDKGTNDDGSNNPGPDTYSVQDDLTDYATNVGKKANTIGGGFEGDDKTPDLPPGVIPNTFVPKAPSKKSFWDGFIGKSIKNIAMTTLLGPAVLGQTKLGSLIGTGIKANNFAKGLGFKGITNANVMSSIANTSKGKFGGFNTGTTGPKGPPSDREGGDGNQQNALMSEYLLLLQKMEQGVLQKEEQARFNSLKSRLGKAYGGIMNVNMNRGQLGGMNG